MRTLLLYLFDIKTCRTLAPTQTISKKKKERNFLPFPAALKCFERLEALWILSLICLQWNFVMFRQVLASHWHKPQKGEPAFCCEGLLHRCHGLR